MRYQLTDHEWVAIKPMLPNNPRGVPRVNDRRVLNGIFWVLQSGAPWRDLPRSFGPYTTCYNRFFRWRRAGVWGRIMEALAGAHGTAVQMIGTSIVRVHQHGACITRNRRQSMGRSRGGLTDIAKAQCEPEIQPYRVADRLGREPVPLKRNLSHAFSPVGTRYCPQNGSRFSVNLTVPPRSGQLPGAAIGSKPRRVGAGKR